MDATDDIFNSLEDLLSGGLDEEAATSSASSAEAEQQPAGLAALAAALGEDGDAAQAAEAAPAPAPAPAANFDGELGDLLGSNSEEEAAKPNTANSANATADDALQTALEGVDEGALKRIVAAEEAALAEAEGDAPPAPAPAAAPAPEPSAVERESSDEFSDSEWDEARAGDAVGQSRDSHERRVAAHRADKQSDGESASSDEEEPEPQELQPTAAAPPPAAAPEQQPDAGEGNEDGTGVSIDVTVPDGLSAGDSLTLELEDGRELEVEIPNGLGPGDLFEIEIGEEPAADSAAARRRSAQRELSDAEVAQVLAEEHQRRTDWLRQVPMFSEVGSDAFMDDLAKKLEVRTVRREHLIIEKGTVGDEMYFIARGEAHVLNDLEGAPFSSLGEGAFCGEGALLEDGRRNAYVRVATETVKLYALSRSNLQSVLQEYPAVESLIRAPIDERRRAREAAAATAEADADAEAAQPEVVVAQKKAPKPLKKQAKGAPKRARRNSEMIADKLGQLERSFSSLQEDVASAATGTPSPRPEPTAAAEDDPGSKAAPAPGPAPAPEPAPQQRGKEGKGQTRNAGPRGSQGAQAAGRRKPKAGVHTHRGSASPRAAAGAGAGARSRSRASDPLSEALERLCDGLLSKRQARETFRKMDKDSSGSLDGRELKIALKRLHLALDDKHLAAVIAHLDADGDGGVQINEFVSLVWERKLVLLRRRFAAAAHTAGGVDLPKLFKHYDRDNSGALEYEEFRQAVRKTGGASFTQSHVPDQELREMFDHVDKDQNGTIGLSEFIALLQPVEGDRQTTEASHQVGARRSRPGRLDDLARPRKSHGDRQAPRAKTRSGGHDGPNFGTRMHDQEQERRQRLRLEEEQREKERQRTIPTVTSPTVPKTRQLREEVLRKTGDRLHGSAEEKERRRAEVQVHKAEEEVAIVRSPRLSAGSRKILQARGAREGPEERLAALCKPTLSGARDDQDTAPDATDGKALSAKELEDFVARQQQDVENRHSKRKQAREAALHAARDHDPMRQPPEGGEHSARAVRLCLRAAADGVCLLLLSKALLRRRSYPDEPPQASLSPQDEARDHTSSFSFPLHP